MRVSTWRLTGVGFVTLSAAGVAASLACGIVYGALWGAGAYASTFLVLLLGVAAAARVAPPAATEIEQWQLAEREAAAAPSEMVAGTASSNAPPARPARRLSDKITMAFEHACQNGDVKLAEKLLESLELLLLGAPSPVEERALRLEVIIAGRNRLASLRGPEETALQETAGPGQTAEA